MAPEFPADVSEQTARAIFDWVRGHLQDAGYDVMLVGADDLVPDPSALLARIARALARENAR